MTVFGWASPGLRLGAIVAFLGYLFAGAILVLPAGIGCARCVRYGVKGAVRSGSSCPLFYHSAHCHNGPKKALGRITLCLDGCLRHDGQSGAIPSLAKLLSVPPFPLFGWLLIHGAIEKESPPVLAAAPLPLLHPPSVPL